MGFHRSACVVPVQLRRELDCPECRYLDRSCRDVQFPHCFVVEREIDCMSIDECGFASVGLGSTSNIGKIFEHDTSKTVLILALDNDQRGNKANVKLMKLCDEHRVPYIVAQKDIWSDYKDANELLVKDHARLIASLQSHSERAVTLDKDKWLLECRDRQQADSDWRGSLIRNQSDNAVKNALSNLETIFLNDPKYKGKIEFNELTQMRTFNRQEWKDVTENRIKLHLEKEYSLFTSIDSINQICSIIADDNPYHPIKEYLNSVQWDGKLRLKSVFTDFLGATDNIYTQSVAVITFVGAVARIFEAGVKFDTCMVFVGKQGKWIIELGEGTAFQKSIKERSKQAIASQPDFYRKPYGRNPEQRPRQCVFLGTTNNYDFLKDETGDRRYYPIDVNIVNATKNIDKDLIPEYISQLWAEAVHLYRNGQCIYIQDSCIS
ncbi:MAG: toprim domain-containing protein [Ruminococcus sp.]|nr:toprim domain-containing protein [Ruminococcus sp.]